MARFDPRVDPSTDPPPPDSESVERVAVSTVTATTGASAVAKRKRPRTTVKESAPEQTATGLTLTPADDEPPAPAASASTEGAPATPVPAAAPTSAATAAAPPKAEGIAAEIEPLIARNDWKAVADKLGPLDKAGELPPSLGLVAAVAHNEITKESNDAMRELALQCTATLLGMRVDSDVVRVISRRLLRKNPVRFRERPAPPARVSLIIVGLTLGFGAAVGWLLSSGVGQRLLNR